MSTQTAQGKRAMHGLRAWTPERTFYAAMAAAFVLLVFVGYAPSYYLRGLVPLHRPVPAPSLMVHLHAAVFSLWIGLFAVQAALVAAHRRDLHRRLGLWAMALAVAMVVVGMLVAIQGVARQSGPPGIPPLQWLAVPVFDMVFFTVLVAAACVLRADPQAHKRLMLVTMIGLMAPAVARIPFPRGMPVSPVTLATGALLFPLLAWDLRTRGSLHRATVLGTLALVAWRVLPAAVWKTPAWLAFAGWLAG